MNSQANQSLFGVSINIEDDKRYSIEKSGDKIISIQGAELIEPTSELEYHVDEDLEIVGEPRIKWLRIIIPDDNLKLSQIFKSTPYGILKKNRTGIGATTLELKSNRNSIIVVPTKALALDKVENSKIQGTERYAYLYVGGKLSSENNKYPNISDYLNDPEIPIKKFVVVADSLPKLDTALGASMFTDYFLMVDEIDSYQYDSSYRPALEYVLDYYFLFPENKRCLVSATVGTFSNKKIAEEPVLNIDFKNHITRNIELIHTNNVIQATAKKIKNLLISNPDEKILIAFNSITKGILKVIDQLDPELQGKCSVMCSPKSSAYIKGYEPEKELGNKLPNQINFMTCTYFVGIDITERFHLISVCSPNQKHSLLSEDKFIQILGRCRDKDGVYSETIIYNTKPVPEGTKDVNLYLRELKEFLLDEANLLVDYRDNLIAVNMKYPKLMNSYILDLKEYIKKSIKSYLGTKPVTLIRKNINKELVPAYFNIDSIMIQMELLYMLYSDKQTLKELLTRDGNKVEYIEWYYQGNEIDDLVESPEIEEIRKLEVDDIISILRESAPEERVELAGKIVGRKTNNATIFLKRYRELFKYVEFEELTQKLKQMIDSKKSLRYYNRFYNSVIFWALSDEHPLKENITAYFKIGERYTSKEIAEKMKGIFANYFPPNNNLSEKSLIEKSSVFFTKDRIRERSEHKFRYKVLNYNSNDLINEPLTIIPSNVVASRYFRF